MVSSVEYDVWHDESIIFRGVGVGEYLDGVDLVELDHTDEILHPVMISLRPTCRRAPHDSGPPRSSRVLGEDAHRSGSIEMPSSPVLALAISCSSSPAPTPPPTWRPVTCGLRACIELDPVCCAWMAGCERMGERTWDCTAAA